MPLKFLAASLLLASVQLAFCTQLYNQPVIGILTFPVGVSDTLVVPPTNVENKEFSQYFDASYVQWLSEGGARVAPIAFDLDDADLRDLLGKVNGVLFTGGKQSRRTRS